MQTLFNYIKTKCNFPEGKVGPEMFYEKRLEQLLTGMNILEIQEFVDLDVRNIVITHNFSLDPPFKDLTEEEIISGDLNLSGLVYVGNENKVFFK